MGEPEALLRGRAAYDRHAWGDAFAALVTARDGTPFGTADMERLAVAAHMTGHDDDATGTLERLHHLLLDHGEVERAVRWALWLAMILFQRGHEARGGGWLSRAHRLLGEHDRDCPERGFLLVPAALQALGGDAARAHELFEEVTSVAHRFDDPDLAVMGLLGQGQALVAMGHAHRGTAMLDEAMVAATADRVSPIMAGIAYCALIITCRAVFDLGRAQEWTADMSRWCEDQQDLRPYRGQCLVHRSEIMQLTGEWSQAMQEVERACDHLSDPLGDPVMGMARYQQAELLRLQGEFTRAEASYRQASQCGHPAHPGLALLRLVQGRIDDAQAAIRREVEATPGDRVRRAQLLAAHVEIQLAAGDVPTAQEGMEELGTIAADFGSPYLEAVAAEARGAVLLATGEFAAACGALRRAARGWAELDTPYEGARTRLLMARACRQLDDHDTADLELAAARRVFEELGAAPALAAASELSRPAGRAAPGGLTPRELEVLRQVATGATNRQVADTLVISEKTVERHLSNLFPKLGIHSRAAATAWAYEHDLA